eukprot:scaffold2012_cov228-Pinguiococcus_pyrenoidosus.AAC.2
MVRGFGRERRRAREHHEGHDPKGPDVNLHPVVVPSKNLGGDVPWRAASRQGVVPSLVKNGCEAEVHELQCGRWQRAGVDHVLGLDVAMDDVPGVAVLQGASQGCQRLKRFSLGIVLVLHDACVQLSSAA